MTWDDVTGFLENRIVEEGEMVDPDKGKKWIRRLGECEDGELLGISIAIDIAAGALSAKVFGEILDEIDADAPDAREEFGRFVNSRDEEYVCRSEFNDGSMEEQDSYVRIVELGNFIKFYFGGTNSPREVQRFRTMLFDEEDGLDLSGVRKWWRGRRRNVWVTSRKGLDALLEDVSPSRRGHVVCDALALTVKNGVGAENAPELVAVRYPEGFSASIGCVQPTALDASWEEPGGHYISHGNEDDWGTWGKTHGLEGKVEGQRERVHSYFKDLTSGYHARYIGPVNPPAECKEELVNEAYRRVESTISGSAATTST